MLRRLALVALLAFAPSLALAQVNSPDFSVAAYVRNVLNGNVVIGGNLTVGGIIIDNTNGITLNSPTGGAKGAGTINIAADYYKNGTIIPETVSAPLTLTAGLLACPSCVLISGTAHGDSAYSILSTDRYVYTNTAFTLPRTWTLPAANSLPVGTTIWVQDAQGTVTTTNTLTIQRAGADTIDVGNTSFVISGAGGGITFTTDGISNWGLPIQTPSTGGTGQKTLTNHGVLVGAGVNPLTQLAVAASGQVLLGQTGADPAFTTLSQDCTVTAPGVVTCTKTNNVAFTAGATAAAGQLPGEPTTGSASAGNVGEYITATQATPQALTTNTALSIISISLTAGDWDVSGTLPFVYAATTVAQTIVADISLTNNTLDGTTGRLNSFNFGSSGVIPNGGFTMNTPTVRLSLASTTTVFLIAQSGFTTSTATAVGIIRARRAR